MSTSTTPSSSTETTTPTGPPLSPASSSPLSGQEPTAPTLTSPAATSPSISVTVSTTTSTPSSHLTPSQTTSVTPSSISLTSSSTVASPTASSTASTHSTHTSLPTPSPNNVSTGALAGAIVGSIIGTAALTILAAFLFFRRRRKGAGAGRSEQYIEEKAPQHPPLLPLGAAASSHYTPEPADDETVRARILTLFDHASLHVDNYYASGASSTPHVSATSLTSYESPYLPSPIATLLAKPGRLRAVLTHVLVRELLQQITAGPGKGGLLPACYASCPQVLNQTPETDQLLFNWRTLTAYLHQHQQAARDVDDHAIDRLAERFVDTFAGYASPAHTRAERLQHLRSVASAAAELGRWLFAQPCAYEFVWDRPGRQGMAITPRVVKVCDEQGRRLAVPQVMAEGTSV
ncbi:hypothetical protein IFM46972_08988 [Aspergillus udagawae]|uniref:Uncharacterized protein n=1 Tax=Aspergillus udagawae TaxID=91492 RepID=A0A8E0QJH7_9EURO|nr:uncharacterized protein Aud_002804 [Aspergillus udagawae]GFF50195.1 hypothetical protein IFM46972_08988 [Aspergillus udagawae]GIC86432.1 hypothetical protein Aud_002804 [Aspergillus udagawae]